ncbi:gas vesicle protein K [Halochromatium glycolicum]|uniref:Gas vesicle protein K n=1 Tax=Halochromatium glycolicum TaxID=85075 RepID=A0AAJ0U7Q0_9GAMM|nr:gas vesicle protein K [Halochromatium glycolicum]MBK1706853.1 gas vesicle protein K [Halochromatium glycolicum]
MNNEQSTPTTPGESGTPLAAAASSTVGGRKRLEIDEAGVRNGLAQLVLTLIKLLHELLERQAIARMESGSLDEEEIERLGLTLMRQAEELERVREAFGLRDEDLNIDLGPLGRLF